MACQRWCVKGGCRQVPRLPRETKVDVTKCHACHVKWRWMSPCATPAMQSGAAPQATNGDQRRPSAPPSATCTTPATQNEGRCRQVPRLPRETKVDVSKCHACHANWCGAPGDQRRPTATKRATKCNKCNKCHACHATRRSMSPSATPAT